MLVTSLAYWGAVSFSRLLHGSMLRILASAAYNRSRLRVTEPRNSSIRCLVFASRRSILTLLLCSFFDARPNAAAVTTPAAARVVPAFGIGKLDPFRAELPGPGSCSGSGPCRGSGPGFFCNSGYLSIILIYADAFFSFAT